MDSYVTILDYLEFGINYVTLDYYEFLGLFGILEYASNYAIKHFKPCLNNLIVLIKRKLKLYFKLKMDWAQNAI